MHSIKIDRFLRQPKTILSKTLSIHSHQSSKNHTNTSFTFANFLRDKTTMYLLYATKQKKRTEHQLCVHYVMQSFAFKKKETDFYNITHKPAVTHILKPLLEHDFYDVKILIIQDFIIFFVEKFVSFYLGLTNV